MKFNERVRLRRMAGLTQVQMARRVGISASQLCLWEHAEIELSSGNVEQIAQTIEAELTKFPVPCTAVDIVGVLSEPVGANGISHQGET